MTFTAASLRLFAGPIVWALHFFAIYAWTGIACARGLPAAVPWGIGFATLAASAAGLLIVRRELQRRENFLSWVAAGLAGFALLAMIWEGLAVLAVTPCA